MWALGEFQMGFIGVSGDFRGLDRLSDEFQVASEGFRAVSRAFQVISDRFYDCEGFTCFQVTFRTFEGIP